MNSIKKIHSEIVEFTHLNKVFVWAIWIAAGIVWTLLSLRGMTGQISILGAVATLVTGAVSTLVTGYTTLWVLASRWKELTARIDAADSGIWLVAVNGVRAGEMSDADYARILRSVGFDLRTHLSQMLHFITRLYRFVTDVVLAVPIVVFWGAVLYWLFSPAEFASTLDTLKTVTSADVQASIPTLVLLFGISMALYVGLLLVCGRSFRFGKFDDAVAAKVLQSIGCPATGQVTLSQFRQGGVGDRFKFIPGP